MTDIAQAAVHVTFAIRERTPVWLAEQLTASAIADPAFRRVILPGRVTGQGLAAEIAAARDALVKHLTALDPAELASAVRCAALRDLEYTT